jgi:hypothetical protein
MSADADYARVVDLLTKQQLAPYVAYTARDRITGLAKDSSDGRLVVRVSDGKIVSGTQHIDVNVKDSSYDGLDSNPVAKPVFRAQCYRATSETQATLDGEPVRKFSLVPTCGSVSAYPFSTLYVDPVTYRPLEVSGAAGPTEASKYVTISLDQRYAAFDNRWMPSSLNIDVSGSGLMFWLQVHVKEIYSGYEFLDKA